MNIDQDALAACCDLVGRTGATDLTFGHLRDDVPIDQADWWAHALYRGGRISVEHHAGPLEALEALCRRLLTGAQCKCGRLVALSDDGGVAYPQARLLDGSPWGVEQAEQAGQCRWRRVGPRWERGCEDSGDLHTTEKLARALEGLGDPTLVDMIGKARGGYYHDFLSPLALPDVQLVADLRAAGHEDFAQRVISGEFDASQAESAAWAASPEGQETFAELVGGGQPVANRAERRGNRQRGKHRRRDR